MVALYKTINAAGMFSRDTTGYMAGLAILLTSTESFLQEATLDPTVAATVIGGSPLVVLTGLDGAKVARPAASGEAPNAIAVWNHAAHVVTGFAGLSGFQAGMTIMYIPLGQGIKIDLAATPDALKQIGQNTQISLTLDANGVATVVAPAAQSAKVKGGDTQLAAAGGAIPATLLSVSARGIVWQVDAKTGEVSKVDLPDTATNLVTIRVEL